MSYEDLDAPAKGKKSFCSSYPGRNRGNSGAGVSDDRRVRASHHIRGEMIDALTKELTGLYREQARWLPECKIFI